MRLYLPLPIVLCATVGAAQSQPHRKQLLAIGEQKGYRYEAVSHALSTIERLGHDSGLWDTTSAPHAALTRKKLEYNAKNLNDFDAVLFFTGGGTRDGRPAKIRLPLLHSR